MACAPTPDYRLCVRAHRPEGRCASKFKPAKGRLRPQGAFGVLVAASTVVYGGANEGARRAPVHT
jgi:hypothetical protein